MSTFVPRRPVFKVSLCTGFGTSLTRLMSKHFISSDAIVYGVVSPVLSSDWLLLCMCRRLVSQCEFSMLGPARLMLFLAEFIGASCQGARVSCYTVCKWFYFWFFNSGGSAYSSCLIASVPTSRTITPGSGGSGPPCLVPALSRHASSRSTFSRCWLLD